MQFATVTEPSSPQPQIEPLSRVQILAAIGITALILLFLARLWLAFDTVQLIPVTLTLPAVLMGTGLGIGISAASAVAYQLWGDYRASANLYLSLVLSSLTLTDLIWLGLLPGMSEELLFRGVMLPAIGLNAWGMLISSLCFGVLHFSGTQQWSYIIWATVVGAMLGVSVLATGNLLVPIVAHIVTNLISSYTWKLAPRAPRC